MSSFGFVGDLLIRTGVVDAAGLLLGLEAQVRNTTTLGRALGSLGIADEANVAATIAAGLHLEYLDVEPPPDVPANIVALLPLAFCQKRGVAPLGFGDNALRVAVTDPMDLSVLQDVEFRSGKKATPVVVTQAWLERLIHAQHPEAFRATTYDMLDSQKPLGEVEATNDGEYNLVDPALLSKGVALPPVIKLVNLILSDAARGGASDVHIEPHESVLQVRQRVDGLLHDVLTIPRHLQDSTLSRLKIMSGMDIAERRKPQDGRSRLRFEGRRIDLRVSTMPTQFGEKIVIRLLDADKAILPLDQIGLTPANLVSMRGFLANTQGMILLTGPTGSGKTSTLYTALNSIRSKSNNIITLEDPIEMQLPGVNQMQINTRAGVTFASGLRSILRQDPNVILVGEIRDQETADIALGAAQTGHLLLSTLHTNDATATITRLFDLGVQPFLVASSLLGIVAQRLVRRPCPMCSTRQAPSAETIEKVGASRIPPDAKWIAGHGCDQCGQSGFKGRMAIHEVLAITDTVRELISTRAAEHVIKKAAKLAGMRTLLEDGIEKASQGLTTLDEVLRVVSRGDAVDRVADAQPAAAVPGAAPASDPLSPDFSTAFVRVLVVEDSPTVVSVIKYFLEIEGFEVLTAEDGLIGLELALRERPDIVVTDVNMPGMGGMEMVKALRSDARTSKVRIIMLTSESSVESEAEGFAAGADDYILKPVEPKRLAARVKALLARSRTTAA